MGRAIESVAGYEWVFALILVVEIIVAVNIVINWVASKSKTRKLDERLPPASAEHNPSIRRAAKTVQFWLVPVSQLVLSILLLLLAVASPMRLHPVEANLSSTPAMTTRVYLPLAQKKDSSWPVATVTPSSSPTATPDPLARGSPGLGVEMLWGVDERWGLRQVEELGVNWVRTPFQWDEIERTPGEYDWNFYDLTFRNAADAKLEVIPTFSRAPTWTASLSCGPLYPEHYPDLERFVEAAVARYSRPPYNIRFWEFYNEPDAGSTPVGLVVGGCFGNDPAAYADLLHHAYRAVKQANPHAQVIMGGLAMDWVGNGPRNTGGPYVDGFLQALLQREHDEGPLFDIINFHYYPFYASFWSRYGPDLIGKATYIRDQMARYGVEKPLILSEMGMPANQGSNEEKQSRYLVQSMTRVMAAGLSVGIWYLLADDGTSLEWGLFRWNGPFGNGKSLAPRQAFGVFILFQQRLHGATYLGSISTEQVEGYRFRTANGEEVAVAWSATGIVSDLRILGPAVRQTDRYGTVCLWRQSSDVASESMVMLGSDPVYLTVVSGGEEPPCPVPSRG